MISAWRVTFSSGDSSAPSSIRVGTSSDGAGAAAELADCCSPSEPTFPVVAGAADDLALDFGRPASGSVSGSASPASGRSVPVPLPLWAVALAGSLAGSCPRGSSTTVRD